VFSQLYVLRIGKELFTFSTKYHSAFETLFGENHVSTLAMKYEIGLSLHMLGIWEESVKVYEEVYPRIRAVLGDMHTLTLVTGHNYSDLLLDLNRYQEAYDI